MANNAQQIKQLREQILIIAREFASLETQIKAVQGTIAGMESAFTSAGRSAEFVTNSIREQTRSLEQLKTQQQAVIQKAIEYKRAYSQAITPSPGTGAVRLQSIQSQQLGEWTTPPERFKFEEQYQKLVIDSTKAIYEKVAALREEAQAEENLNIEQRLRYSRGDSLTSIPTSAGNKAAENAENTKKAITGLTQAQRDNVVATDLYVKANKYAASVNFDPSKDLKKIYEDAGQSVQVLSYQVRDEFTGALRNLNVAIDKNGNILQNTQKKYRSFSDAIARNVREVFKWTVAVSLIYGPIQKLNEIMKLMIDNEAKLANIAVAVGSGFQDMNTIFESASQVAAQTGESINGVLEGYELAYRATGKYTSEAERQAATQKLLLDSMTLSKLSTLSQAEALDTLVGALKQTGLELTQGNELIDKWVALSRVANVSVETLAESFAITATAAQGAGLKIEELNGVIAVVAENTTLSATEAGNAVRGFISGFQSDKAADVLNNYGVYLKTATGEAINFYDVLTQISDLASSGVINESELNKIGEAIGGGARRGAQVVATIKNIGDVQRYAEAQANAHGQAQAALNIQLETVRTKLTELNNAFQRLAQSMGTEGGLLDTFKVVLEVVTKLVDGISELSDSLGSALPTLAAFALAYNQLSGAGKLGALKLGGQFGVGVPSRLSTTVLPALANSRIGQGIAGSRFGQFVGQNAGGLALGAGVVGVNAGLNLAQGQGDRAVGNIVGGIIGGLVTGGNPIGFAIGSAIGDSFVNAVFDYEPQFEGFFKEIFPKPEEDTTPVSDIEDRTAQISADVFKAAGSGSEAFGNIRALIAQGVANAAFAIRGSDARVTREQAALTQLSGEDFNKYIGQLNEQNRLQQISVGEGTATTIESDQIKIAKEYNSLLQEITDNYLELSREQIATGEISAKQFVDAKAAAEGLNAQISTLQATFGDQIQSSIEGINSEADSIRLLGDIVTNNSDEQISYLQELAASVSYYTQLLDDAAQGKIEVTDEEQIQYTERLGDALSGAVDYIGLLQQQSKLTKIDFPSVINLTDITEQSDLEAIYAKARELTREYIVAGIQEGMFEGLSADEVIATLEPMMIQAGGDLGFSFEEGFMSQFLTQAEKDLQDAGELVSGKSLGLKGFEDITSAQLESLALESVAKANAIKAQIPEYEPNFDEFVAITKDGVSGPIVAEMTILQMLMRDLIDVNEEQLQGIYNLPTDASFYVPFTGYALGQGGGGGGGAFDNITNTGQTVPNPRYSAGGTTPGFETNKTTKEYKPSAMELFYAQKAQGLLPEPKPIKVEFPEDRQPTEPVATVRTIKDFESGFKTDLDIFIGDLKNDFLQILDLLNIGGTKTSTDPVDLKNITKDMETLNKADVQTNLNININSNTLLQLDGQTVANVVKQYLHEEILRQEGTSTITRGVVI